MYPYRIYSPALCAFIASLALSFIALYFNPILGRDSARYVDVASIFATEGFTNLTDHFDWPWLSLVVALIHKGTGLTIIGSGNLLMAVLMAGTCALLTRSTQLLNPAAAWWGCLTSLSLPAFNGYREAILREPGFWMFAALSLVTVGLWSKRAHTGWPYLMIATCSIIAAMCFRLEAAFLFGSLCFVVIYQHAKSFRPQKNLLLLCACLFLMFLIAAVAYFVTIDGLHSTRINYYLRLLNLNTVTANLETSATILADSVLRKYSHDDAELILLLGFFGVIVFNSLKLLGPYTLTLAIAGRGLLKRPMDSMTIFAFSSAVLYLLILIIFFIQKSFMIDRYIATLHILTMPLIALSAWQFKQRFPVAGKILAAFAILLALSNVISLSDKRTHYLPAAEWIDLHLPADSRTYYSDGRISFYAGRHYQSPAIDEDQALGSHFENYDYFILEQAQDSPLLEQHLQAGHLELLAKFSNGVRRQVIILGKVNGARH